MDRFDPETLESINQGAWRAPSRFTVVLPAMASAPTPYDLIERAGFCGATLEQVDASDDEVLAVEGDGVRVSLHTVDVEFLDHESIEGDHDGSLKSAVEAAHYAITVETVLAEPVLDDYHRVLRLIATVVPDGIAFVDQARLQWTSAAWLERAATGQAPPPPTSLFKMHAVTDEMSGWIHTHGVLRCGAIEIEAVDVPLDQVNAVALLVRAAALRFIESGAPEAGRSFLVGEDMPLAWLPWDEVAAKRPNDALGGMDDREDHDGMVGTLVVPPREGETPPGVEWDTVSSLAPIVDDEPLFFVSTMETRRMAMLASERFSDFRRLFEARGADEEWRFLVKLGYQVDGDEDDADRGSEHLWFEVHGIEGAVVDATLMNQPYRIARMEAGDRDRHHADQLSDWTVETPDGSFGPDRIDGLLTGE